MCFKQPPSPLWVSKKVSAITFKVAPLSLFVRVTYVLFYPKKQAADLFLYIYCRI